MSMRIYIWNVQDSNVCRRVSEEKKGEYAKSLEGSNLQYKLILKYMSYHPTLSFFFK